MNNPMRFLYLPVEIQKRNKNSHGTNKTISWAWKCQSSEGRCYLLLHLANIDFLKGNKQKAHKHKKPQAQGHYSESENKSTVCLSLTSVEPSQISVQQ